MEDERKTELEKLYNIGLTFIDEIEKNIKFDNERNKNFQNDLKSVMEKFVGGGENN